MVLRWLVITMAFVGTMGTGALVSATTYFDEDFEETLTGNGWSTDSCVAFYGSPSAPANGCNPSISTDQAHSGTHSLKGDYTGPCAGSATLTCGVWAYRTFTPTRDHWKRFWYRTTSFTYGSISTKNVYDYATDNNPSFVWGHHFGNREIHLDAQSIPSQLCPSGKVSITCSFYPNMATVPLSDNRWYCIETHLNLGTPGSANGSAEIFIDGVQTLGVHNRQFLEEGQSDGINHVKIYVQSGSGLMYYDDFAVGTTRIGCTAAPGSDTSPPAPPFGLRVQ